MTELGKHCFGTLWGWERTGHFMLSGVSVCVCGGGGVDLPTLTVSQFLPFLSCLRNINLVFSRHSKKSQTEA